MNRKIGIIATIFALAACVALATGCAGQTGSANSAITVSASSKTQVVPDKAALSITLTGTAATSDAAKAASKEAADKAQAQLKSVGVAEDKMKATEGQTLESYGYGAGQPVLVQEPYGGYYDQWGNWIEPGVMEYYVNGTGTTGFTTTTTIAVSECDAASLGKIAREAKAAGATAIDSVVFSGGNYEAAYQEALTKAVDQAHVKAESLAKASGVYVGRLVNLVENSSAEAAAAASATQSAITLNMNDESTFDVTPTAVPVEANVTVSYAIS